MYRNILLIELLTIIKKKYLARIFIKYFGFLKQNKFMIKLI